MAESHNFLSADGHSQQHPLPANRSDHQSNSPQLTPLSTQHCPQHKTVLISIRFSTFGKMMAQPLPQAAPEVTPNESHTRNSVKGVLGRPAVNHLPVNPG
jgi:hypothetical protein